jgi:hypothetical protein
VIKCISIFGRNRDGEKKNWQKKIKNQPTRKKKDIATSENLAELKLENPLFHRAINKY